MLRDTLILTLQNPRVAAQRVLGWNLGLGQGWAAIALVAVVSAALGFVGFSLSPAADEPQLQAFFGSPLRMAAVQFGVQATTALLIYVVGRQFGGTGSLAGALVVTAWVEALLILLQGLEIVAMLVLPTLAEVLGFAGLGLYAVLLTLFVSELHGFRSAMLVFLGILGVSIVAGLLMITAAAAFLGGLPHV